MPRSYHIAVDTKGQEDSSLPHDGPADFFPIGSAFLLPTKLMGLKLQDLQGVLVSITVVADIVGYALQLSTR